MENIIRKEEVVEKNAVFSKDLKKRYELTVALQGKKEKSILVICLNPASDNIQKSDSTTNYLMNNLFEMGYTIITVCNLFSNICTKLNTENMSNNSENIEYIKNTLDRNFNTILIAYGNTFTLNKRVDEEKRKIDDLLISGGKKAMELVDKDELYSRLKTIHPLYAGQRFSGNWKFRKHFITEDKVEKDEVKK